MQNITSTAPEKQAPSAEEPLHPYLADEVRRMERTIARIKNLAPLMAVAQDLEKRFPGQYTSKFIGLAGEELNLSFRFNAMQEVTEMLRHLATKHNLHLTRNVTTSEDGSMHFWSLPRLCIIGHFSSSESSACKLVQVGTKTLPVYKLQCAEKPADVPAPEEEDGMPFDDTEGPTPDDVDCAESLIQEQDRIEMESAAAQEGGAA